MREILAQTLDISGNELDQVQQISLEQLGIKATEFVKRLEGTFLSLPLDSYDQRVARFRFLRARLGGFASHLDALFPRYHAGELADEALEPFLAALSDDDREGFHRIVPFRRRAMNQYRLQRTEHDTWNLEYLADSGTPFIQEAAPWQPGDPDLDYRGLPRRFEAIDPSLTQTSEYRDFLSKVADCVYTRCPTSQMIMFVHHVHTFVTPEEPVASNTPEGIHQDGADFIISALVIERHQVEGGESRIYLDDRKEPALSTQLEVGQGIFQPDRGTRLWHDLTPIRLSPTGQYGFRSVIGIDMHLL